MQPLRVQVGQSQGGLCTWTEPAAESSAAPASTVATRAALAVATSAITTASASPPATAIYSATFTTAPCGASTSNAGVSPRAAHHDCCGNRASRAGCGACHALGAVRSAAHESLAGRKGGG